MFFSLSILSLSSLSSFELLVKQPRTRFLGHRDEGGPTFALEDFLWVSKSVENS